MPEVWIDVKFKGEKGGVKARTLVNSGASSTVLPESIIKEIQPKTIGYTDIKVASGQKFSSNVYLIEIEIENPETKEIRKGEIEAVMLPEREYPLLGVPAMDKLNITPDVPKGKVKFE